MSYNLALSGGVARGIAHLGVLKALDSHNLKPSHITGVSAGSIAGAFYCSGFSPDETLEIIKHNRIWHYLRPGFGRGGLFSLRRTERVLKKFLGDLTFEDCKIPLTINAVEFTTGKLISFTKGPVIPAILASSSIPMLFEPYLINGELFVDGGIVENIPIANYSTEDLKYLAVDVMNSPLPENFQSFKNVVERSISLITEQQEVMPAPGKTMTPLTDSYFSIFDLKRADEMFNHSFLYAQKWIEENGDYLF